MFSSAFVPMAATAPKSSGVGVLQVVLEVSGVLGLIAAVYTLLAPVVGRRDRRAINRVFDRAEKALVAEEAERNVGEIEARLNVLRREVQDEIPLEARRVYLRARLEELRGQLGTDIREFERLRRQLSSLDSRGEPLEEGLRAAIEDSIRPAYVRRRQSERALVAVLAILLLAIFLPVGRLPADAWDSLVYSADATTFAVTASIAAIAALICLGVIFLAQALPPRFRRTKLSHWSFLFTIAVTLVAATLVGVGVAESNHATAVHNYTGVPADQYDRLQSSYLSAQQTAAWLLSIGSVLLGVSAALCLDTIRLQRQARLVRGGAGTARQRGANTDVSSP
jgi:hypothetical protein